MRKIIVLFLLIIIGYSAWYLSDNFPFLKAFFERKEPSLEIVSFPKGIGIAPGTATIKVSDPGAGLGEVIVRAVQTGTSRELFRKNYENGIVNSDQVSFEIPGREAGFRVQPVEIAIIVADRSFWSNTYRQTIELPVSYVRPKIEPLTVQHNVAQGGVSLTFFRVTAVGDFESGVQVGDLVFPAYPAEKLAAAFAGRPDLYFAFFALPTDFNERSEIRAFVVDQVGNDIRAPLTVRILQRRYPQANTQLSAAFIERMSERLLPGYADLLAKLDNKIFDSSVLELDSPSRRLAAQFRLINDDYRELLARYMQPIFAETRQERLWQGAFARPLSGAPTAPFGERRAYYHEGIEAGSSMHDGVDLASTAGDVVRAANYGVVVYSDDLGIYGTTVIVDHGFGLFSMYGHLTSALVDKDQPVNPGTPIGRTGQTGLAGGDHLHYEMRLHGLPVRPVEWWDARWIQDHIEEKIRDVAEFTVGEY